MLRDIYESYVLYLFLALMVSYLQGEEEGDRKVEFHLSKSRSIPSSHPFPCSLLCCCCAFPSSSPRDFLRFSKLGVLQYSLVRLLCTFVVFILEMNDKYHEGNLSPSYGYLYTSLLLNVSVGVSFYALGLFYMALQTSLAPYQPVPKFLCIKAVIFFAFWQSIAISLGLSQLIYLNLKTHSHILI